MNIQETFFKLGIPTYVYSVNTQLSASATEKIGDTLEITVGWIYGLSVNIGGVQAQNNTQSNITAADSFALFLNLKFGQSIYVNHLRLNHLVFDDSAAATGKYQSEKYFPCNIPGGTDLKKSFYDNPTLLNNTKFLSLNLFYIDVTAYKNLRDSKLIWENGIKPI